MEEECQSTVGKIISVPAGTVSAIASCTHRTSKDTAHKLLGSCGWELTERSGWAPLVGAAVFGTTSIGAWVSSTACGKYQVLIWPRRRSWVGGTRLLFPLSTWPHRT